MFCRFCGTTLPDDSTFCHSCGKSLATPQANSSPVAAAPAPAPIPAPVSQRPTKSGGAAIGIVLGIILLVGLGWWAIDQSTPKPIILPGSSAPSAPQPQPRVMTLVDTAFTLNAGQGWHWNFSVPASATSVKVEGTFTASGGAGNDVEVFLLNDDEFVNWQNGHAVHTLYNSGRMTQGTLNAVLPPGAGTYHLVFNNKFSLLSPKAVRASIRLRYML